MSEPAPDRARARLAELRRELESGRETLAEIQRREREVRDTLLRIAGAIQVLEELLGNGDGAAPP